MIKNDTLKIRDSYKKLWSSLSGWKLFLFYALHYTLLFAVLWELLYAAFESSGKSYIWTQDGIPFYFPHMVYFSQTIRNGIQSLLGGGGWAIPLYEFCYGPAAVHPEIEPLQWLAVLWPWDRIDVLYDHLLVLRFYLVGLSFSAFGFYFHQRPLPIMMGAISYVFCGYTFFAGRHPFFLATLIYLPLLIIGLEMVLRKKKPFFLILIVFLAVISSVYFACMLAITTAIYVLVRFFDLYKEDRVREFGRLLGRLTLAGGIGIALGCPVMLPTLGELLSIGRIGNDISIPVMYGASRYHRLLAYFLVSPMAAGSWTFLGFSVLTLPALILLFIRRDKKERSLRRIFIILTIMLLTPAVAYVMSGFNALSNRWCFIYAFCCAAILMFEVPMLMEADKDHLFLTCIWTAVYLAICYFLVDKAYSTQDQCVMLMIALLIVVLWRFTGRGNHSSAMVICLLITCCSLWYSGYLMWGLDQSDTISTYTDKGSAYDYYDRSEYASFARSGPAKEDENFYRVSGNAISRESMNMSFYAGINGLSGYANTLYPAYIDWITEMEQTRDRNNMEYGPIDRAPMLTLAGVKYYVVRENGKEIIPYGFETVDVVENNGATDRILENKYALPVGYTYDSYLPYEEYAALDALGKQEAQLQAVVLNGDVSSETIGKAAVSLTAEQIPYKMTDAQNVVWKDGVLNAKEAGATMTLTFEGRPASETYLRIVNLDLTSGSSNRQWILGISTEKTKATAGRFSADGYLYSSGQKTQLFDLGYAEDGYTSVTISFPDKGKCVLDDLQIWCQPMDDYGAQVDALRREALENVETNWRGLTGTISLSKDRVLCLSIPYDKGWSVYVDGEKAELMQANTAFMAVELEAGDHTVDLRYWTPGLTAGLVIMAAGIAALAGLCICWRKEQKSSPLTSRKKGLHRAERDRS